MTNSSDGICFIENSDIVKHTLASLINVTSNKTSVGYARSSVKNILIDLEGNYDFLKYVNIKTLEQIENNIDAINVRSDMDCVRPTEVGKAIQDLIDVLKSHLGKKAGYFFIKEFKDDLGNEYYSYIRDLGVNLRIAELQEELGKIDVDQYEIKEESKINIAFIEKR
jgi:hypothetical protein